MAPILARQLRLSIPASRQRNKPGLFRSERPINRLLGFDHRRQFAVGLAGDHHMRNRRGPFPQVPPEALIRYPDTSSLAALLIVRKRLRFPFHSLDRDISQPNPVPYAHFPSRCYRHRRHTLDLINFTACSVRSR